MVISRDPLGNRNKSFVIYLFNVLASASALHAFPYVVRFKLLTSILHIIGLVPDTG